ncbi:MAG: cytidine deaminase [Lachnospiraceae bacterium]|nr:cytidine deaminase [Lachnospiraceae bacterium]
MTDKKALYKEAVRAREQSYSPYSGFQVGAALLGRTGKIYHGCNIENASYSPTNCAERTAFFKAISEGEREFEAIAVAGGRAGGELQSCPPCGVCRQVMAEFCGPDFLVILGDAQGNIEEYTLGELLPESFSL